MKTPILFIVLLFPLFLFASKSDSLKNNQKLNNIDSINYKHIIYNKISINRDSLLIGIEPNPVYLEIKNKNSWWEKYGLTLGTFLMALATLIATWWTNRTAHKSITKQVQISKESNESQERIKQSEFLSRKKDKLIEELINTYSDYLKILNSLSEQFFNSHNFDKSFKDNLSDLAIKKSIIELLLHDIEFSSIKDEIITNLNKIDLFFLKHTENTNIDTKFYSPDWSKINLEFDEFILNMKSSFSKILNIR